MDRHYFLKTLAETSAKTGFRVHAYCLNWKEGDLQQKPKGDPDKLVIAVRLRNETTLTMRQISQRLHMGSWKSLRNNKLYLRNKAKQKKENDKGTV